MNHIEVNRDVHGHIVVTTDDWEVYNLVEGLLIEEHDLDTLWVKHGGADSKSYSLTFDGILAASIEAAISSLDPAEVHRVYLLNNS